MSRIGKKPVPIPAGVTVDRVPPNGIKVKGPKGELTKQFRPEMTFDVSPKEIKVLRGSDEKQERMLHGLTRALVKNMVQGVTQGFERTMEIQGIGYQAASDGKKLTLQVGFSHPVEMPLPPGIKIEVLSKVKFKVQGADRAVVGQFAANIRRVRPPEPYNAKGIKYEEERIKRKQGKAFGSGTGK